MEDETVMRGLGLVHARGVSYAGGLERGACDRTGTDVPDGHLPGRTGTIPDLLVRFSAGVRLNERGYLAQTARFAAIAPIFTGGMRASHAWPHPNGSPSDSPSENDSTRASKYMHCRHERAARRARNSLNKRNPFPMLLEAILPSRAHAATVGLRHTLSAYAPSLFHAYGVRRRGGSADAPERGSHDKRVNQILNQKSATGPEVSLEHIARRARTAG